MKLHASTIIASKKISQARVRLMLTHPFFGALCMHLNAVAHPINSDPICTDGESMWFDPDAIAEWPQDTVQAAVAHEILHCANGHPWRQGDRQHELWNVACDHAVNHLLKKDGFAVGEDWLCDARFENMAAEVIYATLLREQQQSKPEEPSPQPGAGQPSDNAPPKQGMPGGIIPPQLEVGQDPKQECDRLEHHWKVAVQQAANVAAMQGNESASAESSLKEARREIIDWRAELRRHMQEICADDYSWRSPSRRYLARGLVMPSLYAERMGTMVVVRDTSGSIDDETLAQFNGEIQSIAAEVKPNRFIVIDCDAKIKKVWDIEDGQDLPNLSTAFGRGGTSFIPPFEWLRDEGIEPHVMVYLTDLDGRFPQEEPDHRTIWCSTTRAARAPFGDVLELI